MAFKKNKSFKLKLFYSCKSVPILFWIFVFKYNDSGLGLFFWLRKKLYLLVDMGNLALILLASKYGKKPNPKTILYIPAMTKVV